MTLILPPSVQKKPTPSTTSGEIDRYIKETMWAFTKPSVDIDRQDLLLVLATDEPAARKEVSQQLLAQGNASKVELLDHIPIMAARQMIQSDPDLLNEIIAKIKELEIQNV